MKRKFVNLLLKSRRVNYYNKKNKIFYKVQNSPNFKVLNFEREIKINFFTL